MKGSKKTSVPSGQFDAEGFNSSDMDKIEEQEETPDTVAVESTTDSATGQSLGHALAPQDGGLCFGFGCGLLFLPSAAILSQYLVKRRAIAIGIQTVDSPLGGIVFSITFSRLQPTIGFAWATRVITFILLGTAPISLILMRPRVPAPKHKRAFIDSSVSTDLPFLFWGIASFFAFLGLHVPFFYI
ncbi:hypothetical protein F5X96DRAFT_667265 [Biscogniauxia mediterranea]|nr:hypothetical protein F5X96DRAFT_667265 [Biscogniauxia mediterranea]